MPPGPRPNDPTPEQIAERCAEIQATWGENERYRRMKAASRHEGKLARRRREDFYTIPVIGLDSPVDLSGCDSEYPLD